MNSPSEPTDATPSADVAVGDDGLPMSPALGSRHRLFTWGGPAMLLVAILTSLWVSSQRVWTSVEVRTDRYWVKGSTAAIRAALVDRAGDVLPGQEVTLEFVTASGQRHPLGRVESPGSTLAPQGRIEVPELEGTGHVRLTFEAPGHDPRIEEVPVDVGAPQPRDAPVQLSESTAQWTDEFEGHPGGLRIDLVPSGRWLSGFENRLIARVTTPAGVPLQRDLRVLLEGGRFAGETGSRQVPHELLRAMTSRSGLAFVTGTLESEVCRFRVEVLDGDRVIGSRRVRWVSYAGALRLIADPPAVRPGGVIEIGAFSLRQSRPVFIDIFDDAGHWIDTLTPAAPQQSDDAPRTWDVPRVGLYRLEGHQFAHGSGESTAVTYALAYGANSSPLQSWIAAQRQALAATRLDPHWSAEVERGYLTWLERHGNTDTAGPVPESIAWLAGSLPTRVARPPIALVTRPVLEAELELWKQRWTLWVRLFILVGGGLFLVVMGVAMARAQKREAAVLLAELLAQSEDEAQRDHWRAVFAQARREALVRGVAFLLVMAAGLGLTVVMLEAFVWV